MNLSPTPFSLSDMVLWLLGSLANRSFTELWLALPFMLMGWVCLLFSAPALRGLSLGEERRLPRWASTSFAYAPSL